MIWAFLAIFDRRTHHIEQVQRLHAVASADGSWHLQPLSDSVHPATDSRRVRVAQSHNF